MDRFIVQLCVNLSFALFALKSNMDRFIECMCSVFVAPLYSLKSNMDRFIGLFSQFYARYSPFFKIQYG